MGNWRKQQYWKYKNAATRRIHVIICRLWAYHCFHPPDMTTEIPHTTRNYFKTVFYIFGFLLIFSLVLQKSLYHKSLLIARISNYRTQNRTLTIACLRFILIRYGIMLRQRPSGHNSTVVTPSALLIETVPRAFIYTSNWQGKEPLSRKFVLRIERVQDV